MSRRAPRTGRAPCPGMRGTRSTEDVAPAEIRGRAWHRLDADDVAPVELRGRAWHRVDAEERPPRRGPTEGAREEPPAPRTGSAPCPRRRVT